MRLAKEIILSGNSGMHHKWGRAPAGRQMLFMKINPVSKP